MGQSTLDATLSAMGERDDLAAFPAEHGGLEGLARKLGKYGQVNAVGELAADETAPRSPARLWRRVRACLILAAMTLGLVSPAHALDSSQTVAGLYQLCKSSEKLPPYGLCLGFVAGVGDAMQLIGIGVERKPETLPFAICGKPSYGAMVQAFTDWAEKNPREGESNRILGVMMALRANWPCKIGK